MEDRLHEAALYQRIFQTAVEGILVVDVQGTILKANAGCESIFGYHKNELVRKNIDLLIPGMIGKIRKDPGERAPKNAKSRFITKETALGGFKKNGAKIHLDIRISVGTTDGGPGTILFLHDGTAHKKTELELKSKKVRNEAILHALPDLVSIHDKEGTVLELLSTGPSLRIQPKEDIIGTKVMEVFPKIPGERIVKAFTKADRSQTMEILDIDLPLVDRSVDFEVRIVPLEKGKLLTLSRDVTKEKAVENILNTRNKALEAAGNGILITDAKMSDQPIVYCNGAFCRMTGYPKDEVLGKNCRFLQNSDREQEGIEVLRSAIEKGGPCQVTLRNYKKDGVPFWNEITLTPLRNDQGVLTHFIGVLKDVTQQKKEELLKDQIRRILELVIEHRPLPVIGRKIADAICGQIDGSMASILLLDQEEDKLHALASSGLPEDFIQGIEGLRPGPNVGSCGTAAFLKREVVNGDIANDPLWEDRRDLALRHDIRSCSSFPVLSSDKRVLGTCAVYSGHPGTLSGTDRKTVMDMVQLAGIAIEQHYDRLLLRKNREQLEGYAQRLELKVTDSSKQVEETVKKLVEVNLDLEEQIHSTMAAEEKAMINEALFVATAKNFPKGCIMVYNADMELTILEGEEIHRFGLEKNDHLGKNVEALSVYSDERKKTLKEQIRKTLSGEQLSFEIEFKKNIYLVNTSPLYAGENIAWALLVYHNVTGHRRAEENILKTLEREKKLNEMKSRFVATASHEFRTPLSVVLSSATLIGRHNGPAKEGKREKYVDLIKANVHHLVAVLNDFLSLDRLETGNVNPRPEHFDLIQFSNDLIGDMLKTKREGQKIVLNHNEPAIPVFLDPKMLRYILTNLLGNAIKYSGENQIIEVTVSRKKDMLAIKVRDRGIGIPQDEQEPLFELFFRATNAVNVPGTGLGLPIVKQYVSLMGGTIGFKSELGKGTTFFVRLPLEQEGEIGS